MSGGGETVRVFLLDDHEVVRRGLRDLLESADDLVVVGEGASVEDGMTRIPALSPDVAVLDVRIEGGTGIEVCRDLAERCPDTAWLMLTSFSDDEALLQAVIAGASGYLLKQIRGNDLIESVRRVAAGESLIEPGLRDELVERLANPEPPDERYGSLSPQERTLLGHLAEGLTNREIAGRMYLAEKTIKNYVSNVLAKLGVKSRTEAAVYATKIADQLP